MAKLKQLEEDLKELKEALEVADEEDKATFRDAIAEKEKEIEEAKAAAGAKEESKAEAKAEDKEDKEVKKLQERAEKKIEKLEKELDSPKTPAKVKRAVKKSVTKLKKETKVAEKVAKKEKVARKRGRPKKEAAAPKKRGRPAKKAAAAKAVKKAAPKPVKKAVKKKTKAVIKYEKVLSKLEKLVMRTKALREKYKGQGVDLERDSKRPAKPFGWRIAGSNKRPTRADIKSGRAYWEGRPNRADVKKSTYPKLAKGGMMAKGGEINNANEILKNIYNKQIDWQKNNTQGGYFPSYDNGMKLLEYKNYYAIKQKGDSTMLGDTYIIYSKKGDIHNENYAFIGTYNNVKGTPLKEKKLERNDFSGTEVVKYKWNNQEMASGGMM